MDRSKLEISLRLSLLIAALAMSPRSHAMQLPSALPAIGACWSTACASTETIARLDTFTGDSQDDAAYADGTRAIHENRWADAASIFQRVAAQKGEHADGALYWLAYAENKQGHADQALANCAELRKRSPNSRWLEECGALEIEVHGNNGHPVEPGIEHDQDLKLLALNKQMHSDEASALPEIQKILEGDQSETFKEHALFVLGQSNSSEAQRMLAGVAHPSATAPARIRENPALQARAQQLITAAAQSVSTSASPTAQHRLNLDVTVTDANGKPVEGLTPQNFIVLDQGQPRKILAFRPVADPTRSGDHPDPSTEVILLIDTVNTVTVDVAYARQEIGKFLRDNHGQLSNPTTLIFFNGEGIQVVGTASRDGNALADALEKVPANFRPYRISQGYYGAVENLQFSISTMGKLALNRAGHPGKRLLLWISGGWPYLDPTDAETGAKETHTLFDAVVTMSTALRQARVTLYAVNPNHFPGTNLRYWLHYTDYLPPVKKWQAAEAGNLALQVLAEQSGGRVLGATKEVLSKEIPHCIEETSKGYFVTLEIPPATAKNEYHALKVTVDRPNVTVRTRTGYYNQP